MQNQKQMKVFSTVNQFFYTLFFFCFFFKQFYLQDDHLHYLQY